MDPDPLPSFAFLAIDAGSTAITWAVLILLLVGSFVASASEVAFFALSPSEKDELERRPGGSKVLELCRHPESLLATLLIWNNFFNLAFVLVWGLWIGQAISEGMVDWLRALLETGLATAVLLLFGEVMPKSLSNQKRVAVSLVMAPLVRAAMTASRPLAKSLMFTSRALSKGGVKSSTVTVAQLEKALELTDSSATTMQQKKWLREIVRFGSTSIKQICTPRQDLVDVSSEWGLSEVLRVVTESGYSRLPVYQEQRDRIIGVLHSKDLLPMLGAEGASPWQHLIRPAMFVSESMKIDDLLGDFRAKKMHLAVVVDEYGGVSGVVTLEDVMEEIVGEINDEFDTEKQTYTQLDEWTYVFEARTPLHDVLRTMNIAPESLERGDADTLAGLILEQLGRMPLKGEERALGPLTWTVEACDRRRIVRVKVRRNED
ncbi:MAG: gliding motility-associated protein GldE [Cryomorphaceae bacterium]|nr:gliding motility-associated protein GldE [Cryomorphaceae bacterium]